MKSATTTLYLRNVPRSAVHAAKAEAARRGEPLGRVVADALAQSLGSDEEGVRGSELADDLAWYEAHRGELARRYAGRFVAIVDGAVVDHAPEFEPLAERVFAKYGVRSVLMPRVVAERAPARVRSPRVRRPR